MFKNFLAEHSLSEYNFRSDLFPTVEDRAFWENFPNETCIAEAEAALDYAWPVIKATDFMAFRHHADRVIMERPHFDRRNHLILFTLAELKENKGRFLPQIVNGIFAICEESYWGLSAHWLVSDRPGNIPTPAEPYIDLYAAETSEHLAMVCHLLQRPLTAFCPEILDRVCFELARRIKEPYLARRDYWWMGHLGKRVNNWNPWILSNILTVFLLTEKQPLRLSRAIEKMMEEIQYYYDTIPTDGGCDEGTGYWGRAGASLFEFLYQLKLASDGTIDLFCDEKLHRIAAYMQKMHVADDVFYNVADAHVQGKAELMPLLYAFAKETKQAVLADFAAAVYASKKGHRYLLSHTTRTLRRLILEARALQGMAKREVTGALHGSVEHLPDLQIAALRRGTLALHVKGGHNKEAHNHNDVGSFTLYDGSTPVLVDVGIDTYTGRHFSKQRYIAVPWVRSLYHNLPIVNGTEQHSGKEYCADAFAVCEDAVTISFAAAYPEAAGVQKLTRTLKMTDNGMSFTDAFAFESEERRAVCEVLMTVLPVQAKEDALLIGERVRICAAGARISAEYIPFEDEKLRADWHTDGVTRILFDFEDTDKICIEVEKL